MSSFFCCSGNSAAPVAPINNMKSNGENASNQQQQSGSQPADGQQQQPANPTRPAAAADLTVNPLASPAGSAPVIRPLVVCGPAGVGKGTLLSRLLSSFPLHFAKSISHTTRQPRKGEVDGQHYHFTTKEKMMEEVAEGKFIEHACVHGNYYGTSVASLKAVARCGRICICEIDVQGAASVKSAGLQPVTIFIHPPSFDTLKQRMEGRGSETADSLAKRLETAKKELELAEKDPKFFDHHITNDDLEKAYEKLLAVLKAAYPHLPINEATPAPSTAVLRHRPLIICGPSAVGKGTLLNRLLRDYPSVVAKSVSHTTRQARPDEVDGRDYHFTTSEQLLSDVESGKFVEHACVHGNYYGTSLAAIKSVYESGRICLLEIDIQGLQSLLDKTGLDPRCIFIRAPSFDALSARLKARGTETEETMSKRLDTARQEMDWFYTNRNLFDADIVNDEVEVAYQILVETVQKFYPQVDLQTKSNM